MPYASLTAAKSGGFLTTIDGVPLTLAQVNAIAREYDAIKADGSANNPMAVAVANFQKSHQKNEDGTAWIAKKVGESMVKEPWELTVDDLPAAFRDYPKLARETALAFYRVALDGGFSEESSAEIALGAVSKKWRKSDGGEWIYTGEAAPEIRFTGDVLRESAIRETVMPEGGLTIQESADGVKRIIAPLLRVGFSKNSATVESRRGKTYPRYYPEGEVREAAATANGKVIYIGFDEHNDRVDVAKELGMYEGAVFEGGEIRGAVRVYPDQNWVVDRLRVNPRAFGGLSIEGNCNRHALATVDGREAAIVQGLQIQCARLVKNPAAAGPIEGIKESQPTTRKGGESMARLAELNEADRDEVMREAERVVEARQNGAAKDARITELEESVKAKEAEIAKLTGEANASQSQALIEAAMPRDKKGEHVLSEGARAKLHKDLKGELDEAKIKAAVAEFANIISEAASAGAPKVAGTGTPGENTQAPVIAEAKDDLDGFFGNEEKPEAAAAAK